MFALCCSSRRDPPSLLTQSPGHDQTNKKAGNRPLQLLGCAISANRAWLAAASKHGKQLRTKSLAVIFSPWSPSQMQLEMRLATAPSCLLLPGAGCLIIFSQPPNGARMQRLDGSLQGLVFLVPFPFSAVFVVTTPIYCPIRYCHFDTFCLGLLFSLLSASSRFAQRAGWALNEPSYVFRFCGFSFLPRRWWIIIITLQP